MDPDVDDMLDTTRCMLAESPEVGCERLGILMRCNKAAVTTTNLGLLADTMGRCIETVAIQLSGCVTLWKLALDAQNVPVITSAGGVEAVVNAMKAHQEIERIQEAGNRALACLMVGTARHGSVTPPFIRQLLDILARPEYQAIISWADDGKSFVVHDESLLESRVFTGHFTFTRYSSFLNLCTRYGFRRRRSHFFNPHFVRGRPELLPMLEYQQSRRPHRNVSTYMFVRAVYDTLSRHERDDVISWSEDGKSIIIHDRDQIGEFCSRPYTFEMFMARISSLGFRATVPKSYHLQYSHPLFYHGAPELLPLIENIRVAQRKRQRDDTE